MEALAKSRHIRQSAKKIRFGIGLVKGMSANNAIRYRNISNINEKYATLCFLNLFQTNLF